jgi:predicted nucleotidyltransferase
MHAKPTEDFRIRGNTKIRLTEREIKTIKELAVKVFGKGTRVFLFGSRTDPSKKGGDIDLYIIPASREKLFDKYLSYNSKLKLTIGDQKIDLILQENPNRPIEKEALERGIEL